MTAGTRFLPEIIMGVKEYFPQIALAIKQEDFDKPSHSCDLYLHSSTRPIQTDNTLTLLSETCLLGVSKENPLARKSLITPQMLRNEIFLTMQDHQPLYQLTHEFCQSGSFTPNTSLQFDNRETIYDLIDAGMGVSLIPEKTWAPYITHKKIVLIPLSVSCMRHIILQWPSEHYLSEDMHILISYLKDYFSSLLVQ